MYVVKRPFRDFNGINTAGSVVGPADIKRFKSRLAAGHIVEVNEQNFDDVKTYIAERFGVVISKKSLMEAANVAEEAKAAAAEAAVVDADADADAADADAAVADADADADADAEVKESSTAKEGAEAAEKVDNAEATKAPAVAVVKAK